MLNIVSCSDQSSNSTLRKLKESPHAQLHITRPSRHRHQDQQRREKRQVGGHFASSKTPRRPEVQSRRFCRQPQAKLHSIACYLGRTSFTPATTLSLPGSNADQLKRGHLIRSMVGFLVSVTSFVKSITFSPSVLVTRNYVVSHTRQILVR